MLLTTTQAAAKLSLHPSRITALCQQGRLGKKYGRNYLIEAAELAAFARKKRPRGRPRKSPTA